jgi:hypothetical protein
MDAVIYLRVSTKEQAAKDESAEGYSIPAQREECLRHIAERLEPRRGVHRRRRVRAHRRPTDAKGAASPGGRGRGRRRRRPQDRSVSPLH